MLSAPSLDVTIEPFRPSGVDELEGAVAATVSGRDVGRVFFSIPVDQAPHAAISARTALLTFLLPAMRQGLVLRIDGPIDPWSLALLQNWQEVVAAWSPGRLRPVPIQARGRSIAPRVDGLRLKALMAFSGGVDSCHTLWRHRDAAQGPCHVASGLMVHGFDIAVDRNGEFAGAYARSRAILEAHGARAWRLRTNIRTLERDWGLDWEKEAHALFLAACLSTHETGHDVLLLASTYPADHLRLPWGSNPVTDPLMGGNSPLLHDGLAFSKWQKVSEFASDSVIQAHLRVCWQGERLDRNCGRCFKCLTTFASFQLAGIEAPAAFPTDVCREQMTSLRLIGAQNRALVQSMYALAKERGMNDLAADLGIALRRDARRPASWTRLMEVANRRVTAWRGRRRARGH